MCLGLDQESKTVAHGGMTPTGCAMVLLSVIVLDWMHSCQAVTNNPCGQGLQRRIVCHFTLLIGCSRHNPAADSHLVAVLLPPLSRTPKQRVKIGLVTGV